MSVEALDAVVYTVLALLWVLFSVAVTVGAVLLHRHNAGLHHAAAQAVDIGHQPAHAKPDRPSRWTRLLDAYLAGARDMAAAHALLRGAQPWI